MNLMMMMMMMIMIKWEGYGNKWSRPILKHMPTFPHMNLNTHVEISDCRVETARGKVMIM